MPDSHPYIEDLRRYVSNVSTLSFIEIESIERHLTSCAFCHDIVQELHDFLEIRASVDPRRVAAEAEKLLERIRTGKRPAVKPIVMSAREGKRTAEKPTGKRMVLAAASPKTVQQEFSAVATLYSSDERMLLRILLDHTRNEYALYILVQKQEDAAHVLVESPLSDIPLMTDSCGMCRTPVRRELLLETDTFRLHSPRETFTLSARQASALQENNILHLPLTSHTVMIRREDTEIMLQADGVDDETPHIAFIGIATHDTRHVAICDNGNARLPATLLAEESRFFIY